MAQNPIVTIEMENGGKMVAELYPKVAPNTVNNFISLVQSGFYNGLIFHRVIPGFMIKGGGFTPDMRQRAVGKPIRNEADNGLNNDRYTVAMARTQVRDSATSQFFINLANNDFLNHGNRDFGYAVFGKVVSGEHVVETIAKLPTGRQAGHSDVPVNPVIIHSAKRVDSGE